MTEIIYDIETRTAAEDHPGGWDDIPHFGLALAVTWNDANGFRSWDDALDLYEELLRFDRLVGFNQIHFDNPIIAHDAGRAVEPLNRRSFDLLIDLQIRLGHRVSLDQLAEGTLDAGKSGSGLQAVAWWKAYQSLKDTDPDEAAGFLKRLKLYCLSDVELTRDVYRFGLEHGHVYYRHRVARYRVAVDWRPGALPPVRTGAIKVSG